MKQSLVVAVPVSGRSHQIRKHLQLLRHPIVGDLLYGGRPFDEETEKLALKTKAANELFLNKGAAVSPLAVQPTREAKQTSAEVSRRERGQGL